MFAEDTVSRIQRRTAVKSDFQETYNKLNSFIDKINDKIINRIQLVQQTYLEDYKSQVKQMSEELKTIRGVLDQELLKQRSNQRLFFLEEERDFFRGQTMKLNEEVTSLTKTNIKLKADLQVALSEAANFRQLVYTLQKRIVKVNSQTNEMDKLNSSPVKMPPIAHQKQTISISPTKTTVTRYQPLASHPQQQRPLFRSVEMRRTVSKQALSNELNRRQQILEQCIKDVKKKIFYRTLGQKQSKKFHFDQVKEVPFEKFTRTDKEELVKSILSRDDLLNEFYNFMVGRQGEKEARKTFNNKSVFSDKILKIKLCGLDALT